MNTCPTRISLPLATRAEALAVVTRPERHHDRPGLRLVAWAHLMRERGHRMHQLRVRTEQRARGMI
ncbi:hypothetical protein [Tropicimonas marinistellae]|uniref:hypothetical protein n=1 Tax=Tropicimonas marinistellae TaxID=1739787 RepID=UPI00082EB6C3|nr:hypothetical protein [Tropicimonas marinistellae]